MYFDDHRSFISHRHTASNWQILFMHSLIAPRLYRPVRTSARGFTLIEMMAVLTLTALMAGVAIPAMQRWFDSISERAQLTEVSIQFQRLASRAALLSESIRLSKANWTSKLGDGQPALALPEGWSVTNEKPVIFFHSGICEGGVVDLTGPQQRKVQLNIAVVTCDVSIIRP